MNLLSDLPGLWGDHAPGGSSAPFKERIAVGLAGAGSECFGFDDEVSRDHDWGPAFCLWLTEEDDRLVGSRLRGRLTPKDFRSPSEASAREKPAPARSGAWGCVAPRTFTGVLPVSIIPQGPSRSGCGYLNRTLATCTNGKVFSDPLGTFTRWRQALLAYYPEDVRLKKIASLCVTIAQTGQYNFLRS